MRLLSSIALAGLLGLAPGCRSAQKTAPDAAVHQGSSTQASGEASGEPADPLACETSADCALTRIAEDGCCEGCVPRPLSVAALAALEARCASREDRCPAPMCADRGLSPRPSCQEGRCVLEGSGGR